MGLLVHCVLVCMEYAAKAFTQMESVLAVAFGVGRIVTNAPMDGVPCALHAPAKAGHATVPVESVRATVDTRVKIALSASQITLVPRASLAHVVFMESAMTQELEMGSVSAKKALLGPAVMHVLLDTMGIPALLVIATRRQVFAWMVSLKMEHVSVLLGSLVVIAPGSLGMPSTLQPLEAQELPLVSLLVPL